jgi:four helix bundle protein
MNIIKEVKEKYLDFREVSAYKIAFDLSNYVWQLAVNWDWFAKRTVGSQFVESTGSISANIAEGYGRYFKKG